MNNSIEEIIESANEELIAKGNLKIISRVFASDYTVHAGSKSHTGHNFIKKWAQQLRSAIPDVQVVNIVILNKAENTIAWLRTLKGTHKTKLMGIPPSGQQIEWNEIVVSHFDSNRIQEEWVVSELAGHLLSKPPCK